MDPEIMTGLEEISPISDVNVIPFIDIMLVLLVIFMITAPLMLGGVQVNLPKSGGDPMPRPEHPLIVSLDAEARVFAGKDEVAPEGRHEHFKKLALESETGEVYVKGDGQVQYARMMELMAELGQAGFVRVTLVTDVRGSFRPDASHPPVTRTDVPGVMPPNGTKAAEAAVEASDDQHASRVR
jgi:biopolymer transport protein TolR